MYIFLQFVQIKKLHGIYLVIDKICLIFILLYEDKIKNYIGLISTNVFMSAGELAFAVTKNNILTYLYKVDSNHRQIDGLVVLVFHSKDGERVPIPTLSTLEHLQCGFNLISNLMCHYIILILTLEKRFLI
jgi:hypothetical protein